MAVQIQWRRGTQAQNDVFTGVVGEVTVDTTNNTLRVHDGSTAGGSNIATVAYVGSQLSSVNAISSGTSAVNFVSTNGNVRANVGGSTIATIYSSGVAVTGLVSATTTITATGNVAGGNVTTAGRVDATGNVAGGNLTTAGIVNATGNVNGANLNITGGIFDTGAMDLNTAANGNITLNPNGSGVIVLNKDLRNGQANGVGNIGSATGYFNTVFAKATSAQYADLAEMYEADTDYAPGTVVVFGGEKEITVANDDGDSRVAGVISGNPSYVMNSGQTGVHVLPLTLAGRVPTKVRGPVAKGDMMVSAGNGFARAEKSPAVGAVIGKALQSFDGQEGVIEVVVGRL